MTRITIPGRIYAAVQTFVDDNPHDLSADPKRRAGDVRIPEQEV